MQPMRVDSGLQPASLASPATPAHPPPRAPTGEFTAGSSEEGVPDSPLPQSFATWLMFSLGLCIFLPKYFLLGVVAFISLTLPPVK